MNLEMLRISKCRGDAGSNEVSVLNKEATGDVVRSSSAVRSIQLMLFNNFRSVNRQNVLLHVF